MRYWGKRTRRWRGWNAASTPGFACWPFFRLDPYLENLREEPAFKRLVADLEQTYSALEIQRL